MKSPIKLTAAMLAFAAWMPQLHAQAYPPKPIRPVIGCATGCDADFLTPAQTVDRIKADHAKWGRVIREANIKAE